MNRRYRLLLRIVPGALLLLLCLFSRHRFISNTTYASVDPVADRHEFHQKTAAKYDFHFGNDKPFLPSNAQTDTGEFLDPKNFPTAQYCSHCHQESHKEWRQSAHANSFRTPWYKRNVNMLMQSKGPEFARHCEGCHNPIALLSGSITKGVSQKRPTDDAGVTCTVCHSIKQVDQRGTGSYVMGQPAVLVDEAGKPIYGSVSDAEILFHLDRHSKAVMQDFYKTSQFCTSCHKAALPETLNNYKWQRAFSVADEWQLSSFSKESPLPFYSKDSVSTCQTCHMGKDALSLPDAGAKNGKLASHRWLGANTLIPTYYDYSEQLAKATAFLKNGTFNVDFFALETNRQPGLIAPLGLQPFTLQANDAVTVSVVIQNKGIAHSHVPEQRDMYESWVQFAVKDDQGRMVMQSGFLKPDGTLDERAHSFTNRLINKNGTLNDLHQVWDNRVVAYNNTIQSGRSQIVRYQFRIPAAMTSGNLSVTARVNYRRFNQHFVDFGLSQHYIQPVVTMAERTRIFHIGQNAAETVDPADDKEWMRWNNYGVGLLDAQQYGEAAQAFEQVSHLRPNYADAYTNIALANFQWQRYAVARENLEKALKLSPDHARALYYMALVERNSGNLEAAVVDLEKVIKQFPRSRDARRELGFSFYQQHQYESARQQYEALQGIDPDDLAAHYNLSILYRRLGQKEKAAVEAARFANQKDDPSANTFALEYLRQHGEIAAESVPWHIHSDIDHGDEAIAGKAHP